MKLKDFLETNDACEPGKMWALTNCTTIHEALNHPKADYGYIKWAAKRLLTKEESVEWALFCCDLVKHLMKDQRSLDAVEAVRNSKATLATAATADYAAADYADIKPQVKAKLLEILNRHDEYKELP